MKRVIIMSILYYDEAWTVQTTRKHPTWLFLYGDNDKKQGKQGQAVIRNEPNAVGIPTKKSPRFYSSAFYNDQEYERNCQCIQSAIENVIERWESGQYDTLVLSSAGIGTGLAQLDRRAPRTFAYLEEAIHALLHTIADL